MTDPFLRPQSQTREPSVKRTMQSPHSLSSDVGSESAPQKETPAPFRLHRAYASGLRVKDRDERASKRASLTLEPWPPKKQLCPTIIGKERAGKNPTRAAGVAVPSNQPPFSPGLSKSARWPLSCSNSVSSPSHRAVCRSGQDSRSFSCGDGTLRRRIAFST